MTEADPIGPVRLRRYLPSADLLWLAAGCGHVAPISVRPPGSDVWQG
jgi:hypothetical protein